jgi:ABC-2 type transport system ATP-binding protein
MIAAVPMTQSAPRATRLNGGAPTPVIQARGLRKSYGPVEAVRGIDLTVDAGEIVAFLGPNGAGKTTTVEILAGHRRRDAGEVSVLGFDPSDAPRAFRERIGIVPQETAVEPVLTVAETVRLYAAAYPQPQEVDEVLELVGLEPQRNARVSALSGGQQRRLDLAIGIAGDPELLFLDEPTTGFDPAARRRSWELIHRLRSLGKTILLTTHYMEEAQRLADRVVVIGSGRVIATGTPDDLARERPTVISFRVPAPGIPLPQAPQQGETVTLSTESPTRILLPLLNWADIHGYELEGLSVTQPSLEDVYLQLTRAEDR